ncbi:MAG: carbamoyltransferase N-terminal domain-containing protein [Kiritimatiellia bacterium]
MGYFDYLRAAHDQPEVRAGLFGDRNAGRRRRSLARMDLAASVQVVTEDIVLHMARPLCKLTGRKNLCMAGGVALNCVANGRLPAGGTIREHLDAAGLGDAGALGAALAAWHLAEKQPRPPAGPRRHERILPGPFLFRRRDRRIPSRGLSAEIASPAEWAAHVARIVAGEKVVSPVRHSRMEFGPRALRRPLHHRRFALAEDAVGHELKIKYRESLRPFATRLPGGEGLSGISAWPPPPPTC